METEITKALSPLRRQRVTTSGHLLPFIRCQPDCICHFGSPLQSSTAQPRRLAQRSRARWPSRVLWPSRARPPPTVLLPSQLLLNHFSCKDMKIGKVFPGFSDSERGGMRGEGEFGTGQDTGRRESFISRNRSMCLSVILRWCVCHKCGFISKYKHPFFTTREPFLEKQ